VYRVLVHEGVSPVMLSAKGYGDSLSVASINGITEGRSSKITDEGSRQHFDRRVEFRVVQQRP
jgi:outer membrane protein OmpA-like peptidoglycan-associated protein